MRSVGTAMIVACCLLGCSTLTGSLAMPHMYLPKGYLGTYLKRWQPHLVAGHVLSISGVREYARARVAVEKTHHCAGLVTPATHLFMVDVEDPLCTRLVACLWVGNVSCAVRREAFLEVREWFDAAIPDGMLVSALTGVDAECW